MTNGAAMQIGSETAGPETGSETKQWFSSPELRTMLRPQMWSSLAPSQGNAAWLACRRPLLTALFLGCTISLITEHRLTLRLVISGGLTWSFVPLLEIFSLAVIWRAGHRVRSLPEAIDLFFMGQGPWLLWLMAFGAFWSSVPAITESSLITRLWLASAAGIELWSAHIDYWFFHAVLERKPRRARWDLIAQRAMAWGLGVLYFGAGSLWPDILRRLHL